MRYNPFRWFNYLPLRDQIDRRTEQINNDYALVFGSGEGKLSMEPTDTGYCDFQARRCWVNCEAANVQADPRRPWIKAVEATEKEQYMVTMMIAAHERAHARWTDFEIEDFELKNTGGSTAPLPASRKGRADGKVYDRLVHMTWNILEDERIERLIERDFSYLRGYMRLGHRYGMLRRIPQTEDFQYLAVMNGKKIPHDPNDPSLVLQWVLRRRCLNRAGVEEVCPLSPYNQQKLEEIEPLLQEAFTAKTSKRVVEISREIIDILQIREYNEMLQQMARAMSAMGGSRGMGDKAKGRGRGQSDEKGTVQQGEGDGEGGEGDQDGEGSGKGDQDGDEDGDGNGPIKREGKQNQPRQGSGTPHGPGTDTQGGPQGQGGSGDGEEEEEGDEEGNGSSTGGTKRGKPGWNDKAQKQKEKAASEDADRDFVNSGYQNAMGSMKKRRRVHAPGAYDELLNSVRPFLNALTSMFRIERVKPGVDFDRTGSRLDMKRAMRSNKEPFKVPTPPLKQGRMSISIVIDESGSMGGKKEWEAKRVAMMFYEALRTRHTVRVAVAPTGEIIAESGDGEIGKAYVAGYDSNQGTCFNEVLTRELEFLGKERHSTVRYAILIADGESGDDDGKRCKASVDKYKRQGVRCLGVGLCLSEYGDKFFADIFGEYYLSIQDAGELLPHMSKVLRTLVSRTHNKKVHC